MTILRTRTTDIGTATLIEPMLIEVRIHTGVVLDRQMLLQGYARMEELASGKFALLVDRTKTDYSVTYDAIVEGGNHPAMLAQAMLIPPNNPNKKVIVDTILDYPRKGTIPIQAFTDREAALEWLRSHLP